LFVVAEVLTLAHRRQVLDFASQQRLPAMYEFGVFAREGGLTGCGKSRLIVVSLPFIAWGTSVSH